MLYRQRDSSCYLQSHIIIATLRSFDLKMVIVRGPWGSVLPPWCGFPTRRDYLDLVCRFVIETCLESREFWDVPVTILKSCFIMFPYLSCFLLSCHRHPDQPFLLQSAGLRPLGRFHLLRHSVGPLLKGLANEVQQLGHNNCFKWLCWILLNHMIIWYQLISCEWYNVNTLSFRPWGLQPVWFHLLLQRSVSKISNGRGTGGGAT